MPMGAGWFSSIGTVLVVVIVMIVSPP